MTEAEIMTHTQVLHFLKTQIIFSVFLQAMTLLSFGYLGLAWLLTTFMGPVGFVFANCANMLASTLEGIVAFLIFNSQY